jgi:prepilin-type N-terminal cleavage/methylation domain-containing protein
MMNSRSSFLRTSRRGMTLIELIVVVAVLAIIGAISGPSLTGYMARQSLRGSANEAAADLQYARSEAVQGNAPVSVSFSESGYAITRGATTLKEVTLESGNSVSSGATIVVTFDPVRATAITTDDDDPTASPVVFSNARTSGTVQLSVNILGRPYVCASGTSLSGLPSC